MKFGEKVGCQILTMDNMGDYIRLIINGAGMVLGDSCFCAENKNLVRKKMSLILCFRYRSKLWKRPFSCGKACNFYAKLLVRLEDRVHVLTQTMERKKRAATKKKMALYFY